ncbi:MAG: hypothetical protein A4S17_05150 [Proteobacteria bacterium HN_bin10]|nr:MAG: hypothetical protein A4S17_05150 [Proteobacteria bacterium HN_bin10]
MRVLAVALVALVGACATGGDEPDAGAGASPFAAQRGTALAPPSSTGSAAPPEGVASGGIDFGQWRQADPTVYAPAFQARIRARYQGQAAPAIRADLERNGFRCEDERRLDCRIEIMERQCAFDWYVVLERNAREPVAGFDQMCLGANR